MSSEEIHRLVEEYRDGTITEADARRLAEAIRAGGAEAEQVRRELALSGFLGQAAEGADDAAFARSFAERVSAERGGREFMTAFEKRSSLRTTGRTRRLETPRASLLPFLAAAAVILAILGALWSNRTPDAPPVKVARQEPPEAPREEPKPVPEPLPAPAPVVPPPPKEEPRKPETPEAPPPPPATPEEPKPAPAKPTEEPKPAPVKPTEVAPVTAVAKLDRIEGEVFLVVDGERRPAKAGQDVPAAAGIVTSPGTGRAVLLLSDGTRFSLGADATVREIAKGPKGTRVLLMSGALTADVARQPADQPLVFSTPHGEARVLGTVLRIAADATSTRLEVKEGKVRLTRDAKSVDVASGQYAVAGAGLPMAPRSLSPDEIVLFPQQAKLTGTEWVLGRDLKGLTGVVLEAGATPFKVVDHVETRPSYATYTFFAPADKEYRIWMRVSSLEKGDPWTRDMVTIEPTRATLSQKSPFFGAAVTNAFVFTGVAATPGYSWLSVHGEEGKAEQPPLTVKFAETGWQNIRLYVGHPWVRVDAIWLSATQRTRPPAKMVPPLAEK